MIRLPHFRYRAPRDVDEAARILSGEGPQAMLLAGGTDLLPNMKRRQQLPTTLVALRNIEALRKVANGAGLSLGFGPARHVERLLACRAVPPAPHGLLGSAQLLAALTVELHPPSPSLMQDGALPAVAPSWPPTQAKRRPDPRACTSIPRPNLITGDTNVRH